MDDYRIDESAGTEEGSELDRLFEKWMAGGSSAASSMDSAAGSTETVEPPVPMPNGIDLQRGAGTIRITRRWFSPVHIFLLVFAIIWNTIVFGFFGVAMIGGGGIFGLFMLPFFAAGAFVAYSAITGFVNSTTIDLSNGALSVVHKPLPWPGATTIPSGEITQLYSVERVHHHSSSSSGGRRSTSTSYTYEVRVIHGSENRETKLVSGLGEANQALFIEYTIEHHLGIVDRAVRGEIRRN